MCSTSSWKGKDGEDSALALQGAGTWMLGEVGNGISSTKLPKGPGKRLGGNSEKKFPKENSYSKAGMHLCQQNDANSTVQRAELEGSPGIPGSPHSHGQGAGAELSHVASPQHSRPGFNSRIWGGCGKLRVSVHPPHHSSPSSGIMVYRNSRLRGAGKAPLDLFWVVGIQLRWRKPISHQQKGRCSVGHALLSTRQDRALRVPCPCLDVTAASLSGILAASGLSDTVWIASVRTFK